MYVCIVGFVAGVDGDGDGLEGRICGAADDVIRMSVLRGTWDFHSSH